MSRTLFSPGPPSALHFACGSCGVTLSVPAALAGVRAPCPGCGGMIEAPHPAAYRAPVVGVAPSSDRSGQGDRFAFHRPPVVPAVGDPAVVVPAASLRPGHADRLAGERPPCGLAEPPRSDDRLDEGSSRARLAAAVVPAGFLRPGHADRLASGRPPRGLAEPLEGDKFEDDPPPAASHARHHLALAPPASGRTRHAERLESPRPSEYAVAEPAVVPASPLGKWVFAILGAVFGGAAVSGGIWTWQLGRDVRAPETGARPVAPVDRTGPSLEVLVEQRREADREVTALLAAQQTVIGFSRSRTPAQAARWLDTPTAEPELVARILLDASTSQGASLARRRRLPDGAGYQSTWRIGAPDTSGLLIEVSDRSGEPKIDWPALRRQVEKRPAAVATSTNRSGE